MKSLAFALSLLATPALSLSCLPPDVARSFKDAAEAEQAYVVVHGTLSFDEALLPESAQQDQNPPNVEIPARLTGKSLSNSGFTTDFDRPITLRAVCFGPWCGRTAAGGEHLAFVEQTESGYVLTLTPCGDYSFAEPTPAMVKKAAACFKGRNCTPEPF